MEFYWFIDSLKIKWSILKKNCYSSKIQKENIELGQNFLTNISSVNSAECCNCFVLAQGLHRTLSSQVLPTMRQRGRQP